MDRPTIKQRLWDHIERALKWDVVEEGSTTYAIVSTMFDYMSEAQLVIWFYEAIAQGDEDQICDELGESLGTELIDLYHERKGN